MSHETLIHRIVRPGVRLLVNTRVTPNHVTTARLATGIAAAAAFAEGSDSWRSIGAALFVFSTLLDRADGDLARLSGRISRSGHKYDLVSDALCNALALAGLGVGLRDGTFGAWAPAMGVLAGLAVSGILLLVMAVERRQGLRSAELPGLGWFDVDDAVLLLPLVVWLGESDWALAAAAVCGPAFLLFMVVRHRGAQASCQTGEDGAISHRPGNGGIERRP